MNKRILSGMQPTNNLQLGNYLGALKNWVNLQHDSSAECLYCVVDLHAITVPQDPEQLKKSCREVAAAYIAAGIDPVRSSIFVQSYVPEHPYLMWLLATMTQIGKLNRMTQFKDKAGKDKEKAGLGLYAYPVLMAADILLYHATHVPVGDDQVQHIELTRDIASTFNHKYGAVLTMPEAVLMPAGARIMSLRDGTQKMSKSAESDMTRINLTDDADTIAQKIRKAKTDMDERGVPSSEAEWEGRPEAKNLLTIYACLTDRSVSDVMAEHGGKQFSAFKESLTEVAVSTLSPLSTRLRDLLKDPAEIDRILVKGGDRARELAAPTLQQVMDKMGFWCSERIELNSGMKKVKKPARHSQILEVWNFRFVFVQAVSESEKVFFRRVEQFEICAKKYEPMQAETKDLYQTRIETYVKSGKSQTSSKLPIRIKK